MSYTEKPRSKWGSILAGVPHSEPPADNVVHLSPPDINERLKRIRALDQKLMSYAIDMDRMAMKFNTLREELLREREGVLEALRAENIKNSEYAHNPPEVELLESGRT